MLFPALFAALALSASAQNAEWTESRFHRVHLRNGNFIDGQLLKETSASVLLNLNGGEILIRRDQIDRIEFIKLRSVNEKPPEQKLPGKAPAPGKTPTPTPSTTTTTPTPVVPSTVAPADVPKHVDALLIKYKTSKDPEKGPLPLEAFLPLGDEAAVYLATRLPDVDGELRAPIAYLLSQLKSSRATAILEQQTKHESPLVRKMAATSLAQLGDAERERYLKPILRDPDFENRRLAIGFLGSVEDKDWYDPMCDLLNDDDKEVRNGALSIAARLATKHELKDDLMRRLVGAMNQTTGQPKADMVAALGQLGKAEHWSLVAPALRDSDAKVRAAAALALSNLAAAESGTDVVAQMTTEQDHWTRIYLAAAAQKLKLPGAIEPLIGWLGEPNEELRRAAAVTLTTLTGQNLGPDRAKWEAWRAANPPK